jgi:double-stranded uracil-DNA glycosylase
LEQLGPENDTSLPGFGIGFTDVVKRPTARASDLATAEFAAGAALLLKKLTRYRPRVACFHGVTGYRHVQHALAGVEAPAIVLGLQDVRIGTTRVFVVPNPSGANAHYTRAEQTQWYDALAALL